VNIFAYLLFIWTKRMTVFSAMVFKIIYWN